MNRQQALDQLRLMQAWHEDNGGCPEGGDYDAICFAIEAIERSEDLEKMITALKTKHAKLREMQSATDNNVGTTDTISRQAAIDIISQHTFYNDYNDTDKCSLLDGLRALPPAQPEPCEDAVSRKAVQDTIHKWCGDCVDCETIAYEVITKIPPVTPKQRTGKWVPSDSQCGIRCSACGVPVDDFCHSIDYIDLDYEPNFCPNCGADMRGEQG